MLQVRNVLVGECLALRLRAPVESSRALQPQQPGVLGIPDHPQFRELRRVRPADGAASFSVGGRRSGGSKDDSTPVAAVRRWFAGNECPANSGRLSLAAIGSPPSDQQIGRREPQMNAGLDQIAPRVILEDVQVFLRQMSFDFDWKARPEDCEVNIEARGGCEICPDFNRDGPVSPASSERIGR